MKRFNLKNINIFLFMVWMEVIIFTAALVITGYSISNISDYITSEINYTTYDAVKISMLFFITAIIQSYYIYLITKIFKMNINIILYIINSSALSLIFIMKIIENTTFFNYSLIYLGIFLSFTLPLFITHNQLITRYIKRIKRN